jgi:hypothetical protein
MIEAFKNCSLPESIMNEEIQTDKRSPTPPLDSEQDDCSAVINSGKVYDLESQLKSSTDSRKNYDDSDAIDKFSSQFGCFPQPLPVKKKFAMLVRMYGMQCSIWPLAIGMMPLLLDTESRHVASSVVWIFLMLTSSIMGLFVYMNSSALQIVRLAALLSILHPIVVFATGLALTRTILLFAIMYYFVSIGSAFVLCKEIMCSNSHKQD